MNYPQKPKSFQDLLNRRRQSVFVGREKQINLFRNNINLPFDDERRYFIFNVSGQGGVGKTFLLKHWKKLAEQINAATAYVDEDIKDVTSVMGFMVKQLEQQGLNFRSFSERYKVFRQKREEIEADPEAPPGFAIFMGRTATKVAFRVGKEVVPGGGLVEEFIDEDKIADGIGNFTSYVARRLGNKDEVRLVLHPEEVLTPLFLEGLQQLPEERCLVLFFDTYEKTYEYLDEWLREILEGKYGNLLLNFAFVIAGRHKLDKTKLSVFEDIIAYVGKNYVGRCSVSAS